MFNKWMKISVSVFFVIAMSGPVFAFSNSDLLELLSQIDSAAETRDISRTAQLLSDSASIVIEMPTPQGNMQVELNKQQYMELTQKGWDSIGPSYKYTRLSKDIESDGTKAQVVSIVREEFQTGGQTISSETLEIADFAVENGRLVLVRAVGKMHIQGEPIPKPSI